MIAPNDRASSNRSRAMICRLRPSFVSLAATAALLACGGKAQHSDQTGATSSSAGQGSSAGFNSGGSSSAGDLPDSGPVDSDAGTGGEPVGVAGSAGVGAGGSANEPIKGCGAFGRIWNQPGCEACIERASTLCSPITEWLFTECQTSYGCADRNCLSCTGAECENMCACAASCQVLGKDYCRDGWAEFMACFSEECPASCR